MDEREIKKTIILSQAEALICSAIKSLACAGVCCELIGDEYLNNQLNDVSDIIVKIQTQIIRDLESREKELNKACGNY